MSAKSDWAKKAGLIIAAILVLGFGIGSMKTCSDGSRFVTFAAVGLAFDLVGADVCEHRWPILQYGR